MSRVLPPVGFVRPMLPTLVEAAPEGGGWIHEIKYDGYRTALTLRGRDVHAYTRNGFDWTARYAPIVSEARALRCRAAVLDGEMCVQDGAGLTDFAALRRAIRSAPEQLVLFAFDLLVLDGEDLRQGRVRSLDGGARHQVLGRCRHPDVGQPAQAGEDAQSRGLALARAAPLERLSLCRHVRFRTGLSNGLAVS